MNTILIGIAGGTGSGKTTLTRHLKEHFGKDVTVIGHDSYYKRQVGRTYEERAKVNYDHPNAFDTDLLIRHLQELKAGRSIQCPVYSFVEHNRTDQTVEIQPAKDVTNRHKSFTKVRPQCGSYRACALCTCSWEARRHRAATHHRFLEVHLLWHRKLLATLSCRSRPARQLRLPLLALLWVRRVSTSWHSPRSSTSVPRTRWVM